MAMIIAYSVEWWSCCKAVRCVQEAPYVMKKKTDYGLSGNDLYEGFCLDLLKEISEDVGFRYTFDLVSDQKYGSPEKDGWTGMVRELMDKVFGWTSLLRGIATDDDC